MINLPESYIETHYNLDQVRFHRKLATKGERQAIVIHCKQGRFVLKITTENRPYEVVQREVKVLAYLQGYQYPAPVPLEAKHGGWLVPFEKRFIYLYPYIEGRSPIPGTEFYIRLGVILARLHSLPVSSDIAASEITPAILLPEMKGYLEALEDPEQKGYAQDLIEDIDQFPSFEGLPEALIHTDPWFDNLIVDRQGNLYLVDWDDTGITYPLLDVGYVIAHLCTFTPRDQKKWRITPRGRIAWKPEWAKAFLDAYQSIRRLTNREKELLTEAALFNMIEYMLDFDTHTLILDNILRYRLLKEQVKLLEY
jgi:homoserine kinase type II